MKSILLLATGGTIATEKTDEGLAPQLTSRDLLAHIPEIGAICHVTALQLFNLDSTNLTPAHWLEIAQAIQTHYDAFDGFVVTHGTDTMAYTASALSYLIQNSPKPIVLTGAQQSIGSGPKAITPLPASAIPKPPSSGTEMCTPSFPARKITPCPSV